MTPASSAGLADLTEGGNNLFKVKSSWFCSTKNGLENTLVAQKDSSSDDVDPISLISVETCVLLTKENNEDDQPDNASKNNKCCITLQATENAVISSLSILSEARMIEVHGPCDEYLNTVRAEFLLELEETHVYCADVKLEHPTNYLSLTLNRSSRENDLWIYGLIVHWKNDGVSLGNSSIGNGLQHSPFSREAVDRRLNQLGQDLSINAQQCKQFLEMCSLRSRDAARGDSQVIRPPLTSLLASMVQGGQRKEGGTQQLLNLENLLDQKLIQLESRMLAAIDQRLQDMEKRQQALINDAFEKIMHSLEATARLNVKECSVEERQTSDMPSC